MVGLSFSVPRHGCRMVDSRRTGSRLSRFTISRTRGAMLTERFHEKIKSGLISSCGSTAIMTRCRSQPRSAHCGSLASSASISSTPKSTSWMVWRTFMLSEELSSARCGYSAGQRRGFRRSRTSSSPSLNRGREDSSPPTASHPAKTVAVAREARRSGRALRRFMYPLRRSCSSVMVRNPLRRLRP